ncbi:papain family cysteine protease family protein [Asticcacaulis biprosthecium C19]|uniref:Papain family cysteine protease family protein n=1 Tax=Asticcacaulis biprosthecium C19 TaxID=715226 RepID=F4QH99_9CAUL|nr:C1 family peptidase [Asticcacaulis biprosthecium]EGF92636.1 papain family cysteine protease family protein [Asticcacaulis biprosthecium C19]
MRRGISLLVLAMVAAPAIAQEEPGTGYIALSPEDYAKQPASVRARSAVLLTKVDLSPYFPVPGDQSFQGSCTGWAVSYATRSYYLATELGYKPSSPKQIASPAFVFNASTSKPDPKGVFCGGATLVDALGVVVDKGAVSLAEFPYSPTTCMPAPGPDHLAVAGAWKVPGYEAIPVANIRNPDAYKEMLERGKPVVIGVRFNASEWKAFSGPGVMTLGPNSTGEAAKGGHAMVVVGYDDAKVAANGERGAFRLMNSWGQGWGDRGYAWVSYAALTALVQEAFVFKGALPPMIPRDGVYAPAKAMNVTVPVSTIPVQTVPAQPLQTAPVKPPVAVAPPPPPPPPPPTPKDLTPELTAMAREFKTGEIKVTRGTAGWRLTGYGCVDEVQYLRARTGQYGDRVSVVMEETPWPACEIRGILKDAVNRGGVAAQVVNLAPDAPPVARGVQITEEDAPVTTTAILRNGDRFAIEAEVQDQAPYVQIFYLQADQSAKEIWRGEVKPDGSGRRRLSIGGANSKIKLTASRPYGTEAVLILAGRAAMTPKTMPKNTSEAGFMDRLRSDLGAAVRSDPGIRAQIVQIEVRDTPTTAWLITEEELKAFGSGEPEWNLPFYATGDSWGPKVVLPGNYDSRTGRLTLANITFKPASGARIRPETLRIQYRTAVGWRDLTDRVLAQGKVTATGLNANPLAIPAGNHRIRITIMDDKGRVGMNELRIKTGV